MHGLHSTMLLDKNEVKLVSNDIGRHNTLDKIAGDCLLKQFSLPSPHSLRQAGFRLKWFIKRLE